MNTNQLVATSLALFLASIVSPSFAEDLGEHGFANSDGVKIHYVTKGK